MTIKKEFDFVVGGAGLSGIVAAITAARAGLSTALINDRSVPGGNASSEIGVVIQGSSHHGANPSVYAKETGIVDEIRQKLDYAVSFQGYEVAAAADAVLLDVIYAEKNIELFLNTVITDVESTGDTIKSIRAYHMKQDMKYEFVAPIFADCTGDGVIAYRAGAQCMMGSEAQKDFGEPSAPEEKNSYTMGHTIYFEISDKGQKVPFVRPSFSYDVSKMDFIKDIDNPKKFRQLGVRGRFWTLEYGGQVNTVDDSEHISLELRKLAFGVWDYIKNSGRYKNADTYKLKRIYSLPGSRESRRIVGDYVLTENDIAQKRKFPDGVVMGGWPMDVHAPKGIYDELPASAFIPVTSVYSIPFRCLYSKDIKNMMMAGRNISATHIAMSSTRVMATCGAMGQAVGSAAALCKQHNILPRQIANGYIDELIDTLIKDDQSIIGVQGNANPGLESAFSISAQSEGLYENTGQDFMKPLAVDIGLALPIKTEKLESISVKLKNNSNKKQELNVSIMTGSLPESYLPSKNTTQLKLSVEPNFYGFIEIPVNISHGGDSKVYIAFEKNENLSLCACNKRTPGAITFIYYKEKGQVTHNSRPLDRETGYLAQDIAGFNITFKDVLPRQDIFTANNLLGGYCRPYGHMNMWISGGGGPQRITLKADVPQKVSELHLIFDHGLEEDTRGRIYPAIVKDYDVFIKGHGVINVRDNFQRLNKIPIGKDVTEIEIELLTNYGADYMALYGIKLI